MGRASQRNGQCASCGAWIKPEKAGPRCHPCDTPAAQRARRQIRNYVDPILGTKADQRKRRRGY